jgi:hypothetical protein
MVGKGALPKIRRVEEKAMRHATEKARAAHRERRPAAESYWDRRELAAQLRIRRIDRLMGRAR